MGLTWRDVPKEVKRREAWVRRRLEIAKELQRGALAEPRSLDQKIRRERGETEACLGDLIEDTKAPNPEELLIAEALHSELAEVLEECLDEREQAVIRGRFWDGRTLAAIGETLGLSRERVRQLERQALGKLRRALEQTIGCGR